MKKVLIHNPGISRFDHHAKSANRFIEICMAKRKLLRNRPNSPWIQVASRKWGPCGQTAPIPFNFVRLEDQKLHLPGKICIYPATI
jgi:hypothetical protein